MPMRATRELRREIEEKSFSEWMSRWDTWSLSCCCIKFSTQIRFSNSRSFHQTNLMIFYQNRLGWKYLKWMNINPAESFWKHLVIKCHLDFLPLSQGWGEKGGAAFSRRTIREMARNRHTNQPTHSVPPTNTNQPTQYQPLTNTNLPNSEPYQV